MFKSKLRQNISCTIELNLGTLCKMKKRNSVELKEGRESYHLNATSSLNIKKKKFKKFPCLEVPYLNNDFILFYLCLMAKTVSIY